MPTITATTTTTKPDRTSPTYQTALASSLRWDAERAEPYLQLPSFPHLRLTPFRAGIEDELVTLFNHPVIGKRLYRLPYPMPRSWAETHVPSTMDTYAPVLTSLSASAPASSHGSLTSAPDAAPVLGMPFKSLRSVSQGRIVGDLNLSPSTDPSDYPHLNKDNLSIEDVLALPPGEQVWHLGYVLEPAQHGRGIMVEAVGAILAFAHAWMRAGRVGAFVDADNPASIRVVEVNGLEKVRDTETQWPEEKGGGVKYGAYYERRM